MTRKPEEGQEEARGPPAQGAHARRASGDGLDAPHIGEDPRTLGNVGHPVGGVARRRRTARKKESDEDMA